MLGRRPRRELGREVDWLNKKVEELGERLWDLEGYLKIRRGYAKNEDIGVRQQSVSHG